MDIDTVKIDQVLEQLALENKQRFNAYFVAYLSEQTDVDKVNDYLVMKSKFGVLEVKVETICPDNHVDQQFDVIPEHELYCRFCDDENNSYFPDPDNTNMVFYIREKYIESIKKKRKKSMNLVAI